MTDVPPPGWRPWWQDSNLEHIRETNKARGNCIVVLDDDPLGGQCLHDVPVLTVWDVDALTREVLQSDAFLLLTNSRALSRAEAMARAREIGAVLSQVEANTGRVVTPIWRSDSTLRGHFWWEMQAFFEKFLPDRATEAAFAFIPFFGEAGRITANDAQLVHENGEYIPVDRTEFARDPAFGFTHSNLGRWLQEHSEGHFTASSVRSVSTARLRTGGPEKTAQTLREVAPGEAVIVNVSGDMHLEVFVMALQAIEAEARVFACTGAAPFVRVRLGQEQHLPGAPELGPRTTGGVTVVGSYVDKTSAQLAHAATNASIDAIEVAGTAVTGQVVRTVDEHIKAGDDVVLHTPRPFRPADGEQLRDALRLVLESLTVRPRYVLVKGGSTASHIATEALGVQRAVITGQLLAGVPIWGLGDESRWPGLPFVIFAGNVGGEESLTEALQLLRGD